MAMTWWTPLEADPDILTTYIHAAGVPKDYQIVDVLGLDDELLQMLPQPVKAFILLCPLTEKYRSAEDADNSAKADADSDVPKDLFFMKQVISNACGTIAMIHAVANSGIELAAGALKSFLEKCDNKDYAERANMLGEEEGLTAAHEGVAAAGLTAVDHNVINHFIALVDFKGTLYELDGRKPGPIAHGPVKDAFSKECARVCREFMARDPDNVNFNIMALTGV